MSHILEVVFLGTLTALVDDDFIKLIDFSIKQSNLYSSRSEFLKDAVREKLEKLVELNDDLANIRLASKKLASEVKKPLTGFITQEEKKASCRKLLKEKGFI